MADDAKCPVIHGEERHWLFKGPRNKDWWPKLLNLDILHQNHPAGDPMGEDFDYREAFNNLDYDALKKDIEAAMLDSQDLIILDVRTGKDWSSSEFKIKGAVRLEGGEVSSALKKYSKDKTIVLYCA